MIKWVFDHILGIKNNNIMCVGAHLGCKICKDLTFYRQKSSEYIKYSDSKILAAKSWRV